jgi:pilus assembly protein CpaF
MDRSQLIQSLINRPSAINADRIATELASRSVITDLASAEDIAQDIAVELEGFGPLSDLFKPGITDILVNGPDEIYVDGIGGLELTDVRFESITTLNNFTFRLFANAGVRLDLSAPRADAVLHDRIRVSALLPPIAAGGPYLAFRIPKPQSLKLNTWSSEKYSAGFLKDTLSSKLNMVVSGKTGSGKTTLLKSFLSELSAQERVVTIEDQPELVDNASHQLGLLTRAPNLEGVGEISMSDLLRQTLRLRPDRIVVGELRGPEVLIWLQAINTGHDGGFTTVHANSASDALKRLELLTLLAGVDVQVGRDLIHNTVDLIIHCGRTNTAREIQEVIAVSKRGAAWLQSMS